MFFSHPQFLWLLVVLPVVLLISLRKKLTQVGTSASAPGSWQRRASIGARLLACVGLVVALAGPIVTSARQEKRVIALVEVSAAVNPADLDKVEDKLFELQRGTPNFTLIPFAQQAYPAMAKIADGKLRQLQEENGKASGSGLAAALQQAAGLVPPQSQAQVEVWATGGVSYPAVSDATRESYYLAQRGIAVQVHALTPTVPMAVVMRELRFPNHAAVGQKVVGTAVIEAAEASTGTLTLRTDKEITLDKQKVNLKVGRNDVALTIPNLMPGSTQLIADFLPNGAQTAVAAGVSGIYGRSALRVAVIEPAQETAGALVKILGPAFEPHAISPNSLGTTETLNNDDLAVIADTPASQLSPQAQGMLKQFVASGHGLLLTGGTRSFGPGGYATSALADMLPVSMPQQNEKIDPSTTLVIIIDTSGSMAGARITLAKETARLAIRRLGPHDKVGIVEFYGSKHWAAPIQSAANALDLNRALNRLTAGGGTLILPAIEEAGYALRNVNTRTRHVVILTDGGVESGPFEAVIRKMADQGINVSSILVGPGQHSPFLSSIAQWGRGRFYQVPDRFSIPELILKQPQTQLVPPFVEAATPITLGEPSLLTRNMDFSTVPALQGYNKTTLKPTADLLLKTAAGNEPILARWNYGAGQVAIFTSALGTPWSQKFGEWKNTGMLLANTLRSMAGHADRSALELVAQTELDHVEISCRALTGTPGQLVAPVNLEISGAGNAAPLSITLEPSVPGQWQARVDRLGTGIYQIHARTMTGEAGLAGSASFYVATPPVYGSYQPNVDLLNALESYRTMAGERAMVLGQSGAAPLRFVLLWPVFVILSLIGFLLMILLRRWPISAQQLTSLQNEGGQQ